jgi:hypothetical protein
MFMNETFMKRRAPLDRIAICMLVATDNFSVRPGKTRRRSLRSAAHQSNESKMRRCIRIEGDVSVLANECQRGPMLRCDGLLA